MVSAAEARVVAAGSGGGVLAAGLSEDPDVEVLLLEAGGENTATEIQVPAMFPLAFKSGLDWDLFGEGGARPGRRGGPPRGPLGRGGAGPRRAAPVLAARARDRRLGLDQRDDLPPRSSRGL